MQLDLGSCGVRSFREADAAELARHANNRKVSLQLRDQFPHPYTIDDARNFITLAASRCRIRFSTTAMTTPTRSNSWALIAITSRTMSPLPLLGAPRGHLCFALRGHLLLWRYRKSGVEMQLDLGSCSVRSLRDADAAELAVETPRRCSRLRSATWRLAGSAQNSATT